MIGRYRLNPYELHKHLINEYVLKNPGSTKLLKRDDSKDKTDYDVIRENHQFVWDDNSDSSSDSWEKKLARKYFDKLFKEYTISDLTLYKENKLALRWRVEKEVISGKGQFICGERKCSANQDLKSWEVNFAYIEQGQKKNTLVKLRLCPSCSEKLNYKTKKREIKRLKTTKKYEGAKKHKNICNSSNSVEPSHSKIDDSKVKSTITYQDPLSKQEDAQKQTTSESFMNNCWAKDSTIVDKTREEEFNGYLEDLLL